MFSLTTPRQRLSGSEVTRTSWLGALAVLVLSAGPTAATTRTVPSPYATIADAVAAAADGDTILVSPGTYPTSVALTKPLVLLSVAGSFSTTLDGGSAQTIITDVTSSVRISGFTFSHGGTGAATAEGGAIHTSAGSNVVINDCVFSQNRALKGGAISARGSLSVTNTGFEANGSGAQFPGVGAWGGAIVIWPGNEATIEGCAFVDNRAFLGGAIHCSTRLTIRNTSFDENWANSQGGAVSVLTNMGSDPILIEGSTFRYNSGGQGGGIITTTTGPKTIRNCHFERNEGRQVGGGIAASSGGRLLVEDCVFLENTSLEQGGGGIYAYVISDGILIRESRFHANRCDDLTDFNAGGGALWVAQNGQGLGADIEDCTFTENTASRGSAALVEAVPPGPQHPRFTRCIFAFNESQSSSPVFGVISCGVPEETAVAAMQCSILHANLPTNALCVIDDGDVIVVDGANDIVFCDETYTAICEDSIAFTADCGPIGGLPSCPACLVPVEESSWGRLKSIYRKPVESR
jgi:predicted outer membrane repeat protein